MYISTAVQLDICRKLWTMKSENNEIQHININTDTTTAAAAA